MSWRVLSRTALRAWRETDAELRLPLVAWLESLVDHGPQALVEVEEPHGYLRTITSTGQVVDHFVDEAQRLIVVIGIR